jgi:N-acetylglucosaminyl-diphospho-decaprenol L-rhamnosyltransferase
VSDPQDIPTYGSGVAIITVTYSPGDRIRRFLKSVSSASQTGYPVILSDNGSVDASLDGIEEEFPTARVLWNASNLGYGGAVNAAVRDLDESIGWILVVNPDTELGTGSIDALVAVASADESVAAVGPLIVDEAGTPYPSARSLPSLRTGIGHALFANVWKSNPWSARYRQDDMVARGEQVQTGWLSGACILVRRTAFEAVGGFDERFFMYFEDVDLGKSFGEHGWKNVYAPNSLVMHVGGATSSQFPERTLRAHHRSAYLYIAKKHPQWWLAPVRLVIRAGLACRLQWMLLRGRQGRARQLH